MDLTRRTAHNADTGFARDVHHRAFHDIVEEQYGPWVEAQQDQFFANVWDPSSFEIVLYEGSPCGYVCVEERDADIHIREIALLPEYQGRGIGSALLRDVMERARLRRLPVRLGTCHKNRALGLYRHLGFREVGQTETHTLLEWSSTIE